MSGQLRTLHVALPEAWRRDAELAADPQTPTLTRTGLSLTTAWSGSHRVDGARVALYAARGTAAAFRGLEEQLRAAAGAERVDGRLAWAAAGEGWLSLNLLQAADETSGSALLWSSYLPARSAPGRVRELLAGLGGTRWRAFAD